MIRASSGICVAREAVGVAGAVEPLVVVADGRRGLDQAGDPAHHLLADQGVALHQRPLVRRRACRPSPAPGRGSRSCRRRAASRRAGSAAGVAGDAPSRSATATASSATCWECSSGRPSRMPAASARAWARPTASGSLVVRSRSVSSLVQPHLVAPAALRAVQRAVGGGDQPLGGVQLGRPGGRRRTTRTPAAGRRWSGSARRRSRGAGRRRSGAGSRRRRSPAARTMNSSPPQRATVSSQRTCRASRPRELGEHLVADAVTVGVVDQLEVVHVEQEDCRRRLSGRARRDAPRRARPGTGAG